MVSLLDHEQQDNSPDQGTEPGTSQGTLYPQIVGEGSVGKVTHIVAIVVIVVPEAMVLVTVQIIVLMILPQVIMIGFVSKQRTTGD